jgi:phosphatidylinositol kinase/protein kinase (PI-3  family)
MPVLTKCSDNDMEYKRGKVKEYSVDQQAFEQAVLTVLRQIPEQQRMSILKFVQTLVQEHLKSEPDGHRSQSYSIEHHREIRRLTASIQGSLAEAVIAERDERG